MPAWLSMPVRALAQLEEAQEHAARLEETLHEKEERPVHRLPTLPTRVSRTRLTQGGGLSKGAAFPPPARLSKGAAFPLPCCWG